MLLWDFIISSCVKPDHEILKEASKLAEGDYQFAPTKKRSAFDDTRAIRPVCTIFPPKSLSLFTKSSEKLVFY